MALPPRWPSLRSLCLAALLLAIGPLLVGCGAGTDGASTGAEPLPTPSHYRDFESADELAAYLRSDALPLIGAHRGGATGQFPENALPTFAEALTHGPVLLETDVRMTADSALVLMHDETLDRTTTGSGAVRDKTLRELRALRLIAPAGDTTRYHIPTAAEALAWAEGRAVLQLDVKEDVPRPQVTDLLRRMEALDQALVITYTRADARWYHQRLPDLVLSVSAETGAEARAYTRQIDASRLLAFAGIGDPTSDVVQAFTEQDVPVTVGTFGELDQEARRRGLVVYRDLFRRGVDVIATDQAALASQAAATYEGEPAARPRP